MLILKMSLPHFQPSKALLQLMLFISLFGFNAAQATTFQANSSSSNLGLFKQNSASVFLPVQDAFQLSAQLQGQQLKLKWRIAPEHYLYQARIKVQLVENQPDIKLENISFSPSEAYEDEYFGKVDIFRNNAEVELLVNANPARLQQGVNLKVRYQGCADAGLCYPPQDAHFFLIPERK